MMPASLARTVGDELAKVDKDHFIAGGCVRAVLMHPFGRKRLVCHRQRTDQAHSIVLGDTQQASVVSNHFASRIQVRSNLKYTCPRSSVFNAAEVPVAQEGDGGVELAQSRCEIRRWGCS